LEKPAVVSWDIFEVHSSLTDTALTKIGYFIVDFLRSHIQKASARVSGAQGEFDEKNQRLKISCQGPFKF
jgi:hypothetical protein